MTEIVFRHFIPKDEDLRTFVDVSVSRADEVIKKIEDDMNESVNAAKQLLQTSVSKYPTDNNWDLKREYKRRNKPTEAATIRAIHRIVSGNTDSDQMMEDVVVQETQHAENTTIEIFSDSDSDQPEWDTKGLEGISKADLDKVEED
jgi:hypothetical protein